MAHFIVEYSSNLVKQVSLSKNSGEGNGAEVDEAKDVLDLDTLFSTLIDEAVASGVFPLAGIRCRAHRCEHYKIADGTPSFGFVHLNVRIGAGRTEQEKDQVSTLFFKVLSDHLSSLYSKQGLALSFELTELPHHKFNQNNLRKYLAGTP